MKLHVPDTAWVSSNAPALPIEFPVRSTFNRRGIMLGCMSLSTMPLNWFEPTCAPRRMITDTPPSLTIGNSFSRKRAKCDRSITSRCWDPTGADDRKTRDEGEVARELGEKRRERDRCWESVRCSIDELRMSSLEPVSIESCWPMLSEIKRVREQEEGSGGGCVRVGE